MCKVYDKLIKAHLLLSIFLNSSLYFYLHLEWIVFKLCLTSRFSFFFGGGDIIMFQLAYIVIIVIEKKYLKNCKNIKNELMTPD